MEIVSLHKHTDKSVRFWANVGEFCAAIWLFWGDGKEQVLKFFKNFNWFFFHFLIVWIVRWLHCEITLQKTSPKRSRYGSNSLARVWTVRSSLLKNLKNVFFSDFVNLLRWQTSKASFWSRKENEPIEETCLSETEQTRIYKIRKVIDIMRNIYVRELEEDYVSYLMVFWQKNFRKIFKPQKWFSKFSEFFSKFIFFRWIAFNFTYLRTIQTTWSFFVIIWFYYMVPVHNCTFIICTHVRSRNYSTRSN